MSDGAQGFRVSRFQDAAAGSQGTKFPLLEKEGKLFAFVPMVGF